MCLMYCRPRGEKPRFDFGAGDVGELEAFDVGELAGFLLGDLGELLELGARVEAFDVGELAGA